MEIKHFCSLGTLCHSSQLLKRNNLKKCSYPFDWLFSNCTMISHCLQDNFNIFLNKKYYIDLKHKCGHSYYHDSLFNHHNPLNRLDYDYFTRCVERFKHLLKSSESKLFIIMYVNMNKDERAEVIEFNKTLSKYTSNYRLFVINHQKNSVRHHYFDYMDNIDFLYLYTKSVSDGKEFENEDNLYLDRIIQSKYTNSWMSLFFKY
jgi:hypothetical protein